MGDYEYEQSQWFLPHPVKGSNEMVPMGETDKRLRETIEKAIEALLNVPEVGKKYDQQHSDTHMQAYLDLKKLLDDLVPQV